jgi:hypothetical protein
MRTFLLLVCAAVFLTPCAVSQSAPVTGSGQGSSANSTVPYQYQGCLISSGKQIALITPSGKRYELVSGSVSLAKYSGEKVAVRAIDINPRDPSSGERSVIAGEPESGVRTLDVSQISAIADQCSPSKPQ